MQANNPLHDLVRVVASGASRKTGTIAGTGPHSSSSQLDQLRGFFESHTDGVTQQLGNGSAAAIAANSGRGGSLVQNVASTVTSGLTLSPILAGLVTLFGGGGDNPAPAPLEKFALPAPVRLEAGIGSSLAGIAPIDYGQNGLPRASASTINVQINAMDARSFLDRSEEIAGAVRRAMLEGNSLNDLVSEL